MQNELGVQADFRLQGPAFKKRIGGIALVDIAETAQQSVRNQLNVADTRHLESGRRGRLIEAALNAIGDAGPEQVFVGAGNAAVENNPPLLRVGVGKAQALERYGHEQEISLSSEAAFGVPHGIKGRVKAAEVKRQSLADGALRPERVPLDAQRVGGKGVAAAGIVESVDHDLGGIVGEDIFPPGHAGADFVGLLIPADENGVQIVRVVREIDVRILRRLGAVSGFARDEAGHLEHGLAEAGRRTHSLEVSQGGCGFDSRDVNDRGRRKKQLAEQQRGRYCCRYEPGFP